jgi:glycerate dehydrogenase
MNIVVLDGYTLNPGDIDWGSLRSLGHCAIYDRTSSEDILPRVRDAHIVVTNKVVLSKKIIDQLPQLKYIGVSATGYNIVDIEAARQRGIVVSNVPAYSTMSVAQMTFSLLLELTNRVGHHSSMVTAGKWSSQADFTFRDFPFVELSGKTFGIIGFGNIGRAVANIAKGFGMKVLVSTRTQHSSGGSFQYTDIQNLFSSSDIVSLHCPLTDETNMMKPSAYLINTSRGGLIDERALAGALNSGRIAGAGLDVLTVEPPPNDHILIGAKNCIITPHDAWGTTEARTRLLTAVTDNIKAFLDGHPVNVVEH